MNNKTFENKVNRDVDNTMKNLATLGDDSVVGVSRMFEQLADNVKKTSTGAVKTFNKGVDKGLRKYNTKIQHAVDRIPGGLSKKAAGYPWVAATIFVAVGLLLGMFLKSGQQQMQQHMLPTDY